MKRFILFSILLIALLSACSKLKQSESKQEQTTRVPTVVVLTDTPRPTRTITIPGPTVTGGPPVTPVVTVTPPPPITSTHIITAWHPLTQEFGHHHGVNPRDYVDIFGDTLTTYLDTYGEISHPWQTPNENLYKHVGYVWLYTHAVNECEQFNINETAACVTDALVLVHTIGTAQAAETRYHSYEAFIRACDNDGCGVMQTGGWFDFGLTHAPYKGAICKKASDPFKFVGNTIFLFADDDDWRQPPYVSNPVGFTPGRAISQFWNTLGPAGNVSEFFPIGDLKPNNIFRFAFSFSDAWQTLSPTDCANPDAAYTPFLYGFTEYNHSRAFVWTARVDDLPSAPFEGWTNRWGHVVEGCTEAGTDCVPLVVTEGFPECLCVLNRQVNQGNPEMFAPPLEFDVFDEAGNSMGWIQFPGVIEIP